MALCGHYYRPGTHPRLPATTGGCCDRPAAWLGTYRENGYGAKCTGYRCEEHSGDLDAGTRLRVGRAGRDPEAPAQGHAAGEIPLDLSGDMSVT